MEGRPAGVPTWGWTEGGNMVKLSGKVIAGFDPIVKVTREGWDTWYPVEKGEYVVREKKTPTGRSVPRVDPWEGVHDGEEGSQGGGAYWRY